MKKMLLKIEFHLFLDGTLATLALEDSLAVLVELELGDNDVGSRNTDGDGLAVDLLAGDTLDVNDVFETVDGGDLALTTLKRTAGDENLILLADGDGADLKRRC